MAEKLSLVFDGKLASTGELHFYEYSRASYGFARFISTIETFRRTGRVPKRIVAGSNIDLIIKAPNQGSFPIDIIAPIATSVGTELASIPLKILVEYVMHSVQRLLPKQENAVLKAAEIHLEYERERTAQVTAQQGGETARLDAIARMVADQNVTTRAALDLIAQTQARNSSAYEVLEEAVGDVADLKDRLTLMEKREESFREYRSELENVEDERMLRLTSKVRPQIAEMALPLRKSASYMAVTTGDSRVVSARLNKDEAQDINSRRLTDEVANQDVRLAAYDRDTGVGKLDLIDLSLKRVSFSVPPASRSRLRSKIADAIDRESVPASFRIFKDRSDQITSVVLEDIQAGAPPIYDEEEF